MPRPRKPPRLILKKYRDRQPVWVIRDGQKTRSTGCPESQLREAEKRLGDYIAQKFAAPGHSAPDQILISEILAIYAREHGPLIVRPECLVAPLTELGAFWGDRTASHIRATTCREYVAWRTSQGVSAQTARKDLEVLRAALNFYHREYGLTAVPAVTLPAKSPPRTRWLTRDEVAALIHAARRTDRCRHVARYIMLAVYTGTRSKAILDLSWMPQTNGGWIDLDMGVMHRSGCNQRRTRKRQPPVRLPDRLIPHLARWRKMDAQHGIPWVIHYHGQRVANIKRSWASVRAAANLGSDVVAHSLRHTAATWLMQAGVGIFEAAGYLGMTAATLEQTYGHHHPDFQKNAASSFSRTSEERMRINGT